MVKFYTATQYIGYRLIGTSTSLNPGTTETVTITWHQPPAGVHIVYVKLDPGDQVVELTETNNLAFVTIAVLPATASDLASEVEVTEDAPGEVDVEVTVTNEGETDATNVVVTVYDGDPEKGGTPIYTTELPVVEGGSAETINFKWYTTEGHKEVYVVVDELGMISEPDETDNTASTTIKVSRAEPVTVERRDQWLTVIIIIAVVAVVLVLAIVIYWRKRRFA
jgi:subtilase family serine protease